MQRAETWIRGNVLWLLGLTPVVFLAISILIAAGGDIATVRVLSRSVNSFSAILAITLPVIPMSLVPIVFYIWERRLWSEPLPRWAPVLSLSISVTAAIALPATIFSVYTLLFLLLLVGTWIERRIGKKGRPTVRIFSPVTVLVFLLIGIAGLGTWLPTERIELRSGEPIIGHLVESDAEWTTVQPVNGRALIVRSSDVITREICNETHRGRSAVGVILGWDERTPLCEDLSNPAGR